MIRTIIIVHGNIQKSDYRGKVISIAKEIGITGIVQNLSDGTVRIIAEEDLADIDKDRFSDEIYIRNFLIKVINIEKGIDREIGEREYESFYKLVGEGETDERIDSAAEVLKKLGTDIGSFISEQGEHNKIIDSFIEEQAQHNKKMDSYISEQMQHNKKMDSYISEQRIHNKRMEEHNSKLEKILEKMSEKI